jgi:hypothetical protein
MKMLCFRPSTIAPLQILSVWVAEMQSDDKMDNFHKYYIMDDFGNSVEVNPLHTHGYSHLDRRHIL